MTVPLDLAGDFSLLADSLEDVVLQTRDGQDYPVAGALRLPARTAEMSADNRDVKTGDGHYKASGGHALAADAVWQLPQAGLPQAPLPGDRIADRAGRRWTVLAVEDARRTGRWRCLTRELAIAAGLDDRIDIEQSATDAAGATRWTVCLAAVRARIQPAGTTVESRSGARRTVRRYKVFLEEDLALDARHRLRGPDGAIYRVVAWQAAERIGELPVVDAERVDDYVW